MSVPAKCKISVLKEPRKMEIVEVDLPTVGDDEIYLATLSDFALKYSSLWQ